MKFSESYKEIINERANFLKSKVLGNASFNFNISISESSYDDNSKEYTMEVKYDNDALEKEIEKQIVPKIKKAVDLKNIPNNKMNEIGGNTLIGFPNSIHTENN